MIDPKSFHSEIQKLLRLIEKQFGFRARSLKRARRKIGRRLPRSVRDQVVLLQKAERMAQHPRQAMQLDYRALQTAYARVWAAVSAYDRKSLRREAILNALSSAALSVLAGFGIVVAVLIWRGFL